MSVYEVTYKPLGHTHPVIYTELEIGEYTPYNKGKELKKNLIGPIKYKPRKIIGDS